MDQPAPDSKATSELLGRVEQGDVKALDELLAHYRSQMIEFAALRLDRRVSARLDPSDVVQEAQMVVVRRLEDYLKNRPMPFHVWVRKTVYERLLNLQREHRQTAKRSVDKEVDWPGRSSSLLAQSLVASMATPSRALRAKEFAERVVSVLGQLSEKDREILLMRHVEDIPYEEIACLLDIEAAAARKRYGRALIRVQKILSDNRLLE